MKNGHIAGADYICFGRGQRVLIMLPGLGDGLRTVKGTAAAMAWIYRMFARDFTVYMISRKEELPLGHTTRDMAKDLVEAMDALGIESTDVLGVSMGGMIAQWLAIDHPLRVNKLILAVTSAHSNPILEDAVGEWMEQAKREDHCALMDSNLRRIYSEAYYRRNKWMIPILGKLTKPGDYCRFLIQSVACLDHDAYDCLSGIRAPTLVIGGWKDEALGGEASLEIVRRIPGAELKMYHQWGHGLYEEARDFNQVVRDFLG